MTMYRLVPILQHMGACKESILWLEEKKFATAREAFEACSSFADLLWLCDDSYRGDFSHPPNFCTGITAWKNPNSDLNKRIPHYLNPTAGMYRAWLKDNLPFEKLERLLFEYGQAYNCLVPV